MPSTTFTGPMRGRCTSVCTSRASTAPLRAKMVSAVGVSTNTSHIHRQAACTVKCTAHSPARRSAPRRAALSATFYGKGCYFARDSGYSADYSGRMPGGSGGGGHLYQLLVCRVAPGEYCQGVQDSVTPGGTPFGNFRLAESKVLYDSAVRNITEEHPRGPQMVRVGSGLGTTPHSQHPSPRPDSDP